LLNLLQKEINIRPKRSSPWIRMALSRPRLVPFDLRSRPRSHYCSRRSCLRTGYRDCGSDLRLLLQGRFVELFYCAVGEADCGLLYGKCCAYPLSADIEIRDWTMARAEKDSILSCLIMISTRDSSRRASENHWFPLDLILKRKCCTQSYRCKYVAIGHSAIVLSAP
jgi:hypothetical protein